MPDNLVLGAQPLTIEDVARVARENAAVRIAGGASNVTLRRPLGAAVGVHVRSGASKLSFDEQHFGAIGGDVRLATPDYSNTTDRYTISIAGGASRLMPTADGWADVYRVPFTPTVGQPST